MYASVARTAAFCHVYKYVYITNSLVQNSSTYSASSPTPGCVTLDTYRLTHQVLASMDPELRPVGLGWQEYCLSLLGHKLKLCS